MRDWTPRPYQPPVRQFILDNARCLVLVPMGGGKTSATLSAIGLLLLLGEVSKVLVLAPLRVARTTWPTEVSRWADFAHLRVSVICGTEAERIAALKCDADIYTTNYEQLPWLVEHLGAAWPFDMVVADEATRLKSFRLRQGGARARALGRVAHSKVKRFVQLTGTPAPNGLQDLWALAWFCDAGQRLGRTFTAFTDRWFRQGQDGYSLVPLPHAQAEIQGAIRDVSMSLDMRDWFDLRETRRNTVYVELPKKARAAYREMEREMFALIAGHEVEAFNAASRTMKCLQLANGAAYVDEAAAQFEVVHDEKLDALESIVEEAGGAPVLCAYHFKSDRARILKRFPDALDVATPQGFAKALVGKGRLWIGHPASMGHGVDGLQQHCWTAAFFGHWWNLEEHDQFVERIGPVRQAQAGHPDRLVTVHYIVAKGTVDELVMARRDSKRSVQDLLKEAMKRSTTT